MIFPDLSALIVPKSIAFVGASDRVGAIGQRALENILRYSMFSGDLYLVNPKRDELYGLKCYKSVAEVPQAPDLAILAVPADAALEVLTECAERGVRFAMIFTSGFGETGGDGKEAERGMQSLVERTGMRIYGPNSPGLNNVAAALGFTFSPAWQTDRRSGSIGLATQGGAIGRTFMQSMERGLGINLWCSSGNEVDLQVADFIYHMAGMPEIKVIATVIEGVRDGSKFAAAALKAAAMRKPIVALKIGKSKGGMAAAQSHTAAISGSSEVGSAVFRQLGIIEVDDLDELVDVASLFARATPTGDEQVAIYSFSGGSAALAADKVELSGLTLAKFTEHTVMGLQATLPSYAAVHNPVDTTGDVLSRTELIYESAKLVAEDPHSGVVLWPFPLDYGDHTDFAAKEFLRVQARSDKLIVPVWLSDRMGPGYKRLVEAGVVPLRSLGKAAVAISHWRRFADFRRAFDPRWSPMIERSPTHRLTETLTESAAKAVLSEHGVRVPKGQLCHSAADAAAAASAFGVRVVAKIVSPDITHKSDIGGVRVGINGADEAAAAFDQILAAVGRHRPDADIKGVLIEEMAPSGGYEFFVGVHRDPIFGHIMSFGLGGIYIELFRDVARRMLPLDRTQAHAIVHETRSYALLEGLRGREGADIAALEELLLATSQYVAENASEIVELELNPIWVGEVGQGVLALDAVLVRSQQ